MTGFLSLLLLTGIPVSFGNLSDSPFIQADRRGDSPRRNAYVSPPTEKFGLVIQKSSSLDKSIYDDAKMHLQRSVIHAVVHQDSTGRTVACTPEGVALDPSQIEIQPNLFQWIKVGDVAILVEEPLVTGKRWNFAIGGDRSCERTEGDRHFEWINLGPKVAAIEDVRFKFSKAEYVGEMGTDVGSTKTIGLTTFTVSGHHNSEPTDLQTWVDISTPNLTPPVIFRFEYTVDRNKIQRDAGRTLPSDRPGMAGYLKNV
ncbi:MAG: hypothetical protein WCG75_05180, partial [Armatimonadota bacterium]